MARKNTKQQVVLDEFPVMKRTYRAVFEVRGRLAIVVDAPWDTSLSRVHEMAMEQFHPKMADVNQQLEGTLGDYITSTGEFHIETVPDKDALY